MRQTHQPISASTSFRHLKFLLILAAAFILAACSDDDDDHNPLGSGQNGTIVDVAVANGNFSTLVSLLELTDLDDTLADTGETFTVFAPTDDAFAALGQDTLNALSNDTELLREILLYHVIQGAEIPASAAIDVAQSNDSRVTMANGQDTALSLDDNILFVNKSIVSATDVNADNGVIHVVDQVIVPPAVKDTPTSDIVDIAISDPQFSTLVTALGAAGLDATLRGDGPFTVFAPTDAAFDKIDDATLTGLLADTTALTELLLQHVIVGEELDVVDLYAANDTDIDTGAAADVDVDIVDVPPPTLQIEGSNVVIDNIFATNGVIHVIDTVITETLEQ